jgi:uncharacterized membrane protein
MSIECNEPVPAMIVLVIVIIFVLVLILHFVSQTKSGLPPIFFYFGILHYTVVHVHSALTVLARNSANEYVNVTIIIIMVSVDWYI